MSPDEAVDYPKLNVPFSWEHSPGVSKVTHQDTSPMDIWHFTLKLPPPPPCMSKSKYPFCDDVQVPLTPSVHHSPSSFFQKRIRIQEDPFVVAYKKCTESPMSVKLPGDSKGKGIRPKITRKSSVSRSNALSCKYSCAVAGDNLVSMPQFPRPIGKLKEMKRDRHRSIH